MKSPDAPVPSDPDPHTGQQSFPLRSLARPSDTRPTRATTPTEPTATTPTSSSSLSRVTPATPDAYNRSRPSSSSPPDPPALPPSILPAQAAEFPFASHGPGTSSSPGEENSEPPLGTAPPPPPLTTTSTTDLELRSYDPMKKTTPALRNSPEFRSATYGAVSLDPVQHQKHKTVETIHDAGETEDLLPSPVDRGDHGREEEPEDGPDAGRRSLRSTPQRRRSGDGSDYKISGRRSGEELGASSVLGGLEGRFGVTEGALSGAKDSEDGSEDGLFPGAADGAEDDDDNDPPDNSPYPQVRASVSPVDNTTLSINTPRMWILSTLFSILGSSTNLFFSLRYPSVSITPVIALLLVHPLGITWDYLLKRRDDPPEEFVEGLRVVVGDEDEDEDEDGHHQKRGGGRLQRLRLWLAQGRWNEKEHSCVYVSSNVSFGFAFATDVIVEQTQFYKQDAPVAYQLLLTLSTQILGYTFAGLTRRFLVRPSGMIWPSTLMSAAMFTTLHKEENKEANGWTVSRWRFFYAVFVAAFAFYFLPGLLMPALSYFNVITWFAPRNVVVANLFGVVSGLGLFPLTFDWAQIAYIGSPLLTPFWAAMNVVGGLVVVMWIIAPVAYYSNWLYSSYMPILSAAVFDNKGQVYDVSKILTPDFVFDRDAYRSYSRVFLPITYVLSYGVQFAGLAALITHTACWHGRDIWRQWTKALQEARQEGKEGAGAGAGAASSTADYQPISAATTAATTRSGSRDGDNSSSEGEHENEEVVVNVHQSRRRRQDEHELRERRSRSLGRSSTGGFENIMSREDVHNRLMKRYKDAPMVWYLITFISMTAIGIFVVEYYPIHLPWYGLLLALGICSILFIPIGIIMAVTNQHSSIYLICQLVCGAVFPGRPVANMVFVTYGYISSAQGIKFAADLKLGHYMKIPPRILFLVQMSATVVSSLTQIAVLNWMFRNVPGICTPEAINGFTCPIARVHFNGSILWGVVGPAEFFGPGATYRPLVWCFLIGAVAPVPLWYFSRGKKDSVVRKINLPVLLGSLSWIPPATGLNFSVWALVCYFFNYLLKNRATAWWAKYSMTLSAALDSALACGIVVVFFTFVYPGFMDGFRWWGTEVYKQGCDWQACPYQTVPPGGHFGPDKW